MKIGIKLVSKNINTQNHKKVNNNIKVIILKIMMVSSYQLILKILINVNTNYKINTNLKSKIMEYIIFVITKSIQNHQIKFLISTTHF